MLSSAGDESNGLVTDYVYCLVKIMEKDERIIAAVQFKIKLFDFFVYQSKQLTDYIYTDIYTVNIEMHWTDSLFV